MKLKLNQKIQLEIQDGKETFTYDGETRKIAPPLVTVYLPLQKVREKFPRGTFQHLLLPGAKTKRIKVKIEGNGSIPFLDLRVLQKKISAAKEHENMEKKSLKNILEEVNDEGFMEARSALRVEDSFPIEFYVQSRMRLSQKEKLYTATPTKERRKRFLLDKGIVPKEIFYKMEDLDQDLFDVFSDIYRRLAIMAGVDTGFEPEEEEQASDVKPENMGRCVDISGSGLKFLCGTKLAPKEILKVMISPTTAVPSFSISALVEVIKVILVEDGPPLQRYAVVVKYHSIHEEDMELITRYTVLRHMEKSRASRNPS